MFNLHCKTHRYLIEPVSKIPHIKTCLLKRFLNFKNNLLNSTKTTARNVCYNVMMDCRSILGENLRKSMLYCKKSRPDDVYMKDVMGMDYEAVPDQEIWRVALLLELMYISE